MPKLFRAHPPRDLVEDILKTANLHGLDDATLFSKSCINLSKFEDYIPQLEPYYVPCKAREFLYNINSSRAITIMRQIIAAYSYKLKTQEKTYGGVKGIWYQIYSLKSSHLEQEVLVEFN